MINSCTHIRSKQEKLTTNGKNEFDCLTSLMEAYDCKNNGDSKNLFLLRDMLVNLMFAGRDATSITLSWFFWLLTKNPSVETKIREDIGNCECFFNVEESPKLVYLHAALSETLRLFPPLPWQCKYSMKSVVFPSGLQIGANTKVVLSFYAMGRMESIWGKDCMEFKPERWISDSGGIKYEPSFKFTAFNAGPRSCLGKEMAFFQMKMVAATVIHNYQIKVAVEDYPIMPSSSIVLRMRHGFPIKISKRKV